jgi:hypothetical protein
VTSPRISDHVPPLDAPPPSEALPPSQAPPLQDVPTAANGLFGMRRGVLMLIGAAVLVSAVAVGVVVTKGGTGAAPDVRSGPDIKITACRPATVSETVGTLDYTITNNSSQARLYVVNFLVKDAAGNKIGEGSDITTTLDAGQTLQDQAFINGPTSAGNSCELVGAIDAS